METANTGYTSSGIDARLRLVAAGEVNYDEDGTWEQHLRRLRRTSDGVMDVVHGRRDEFGADFVSLFVVENDDGVGLGYCTSDSARAFSVVNWVAAVSNFSFHHEIGHNQGCQHNREDDEVFSCEGAYGYSYGWRFFGDDGVGYRTIMSYNNDDGDFTRINLFSNPFVFHEGQPTGRSIGTEDEAHNARSIDNRSATVQGFRVSRFDVWVDFDYGGTERGTFSQPFNTVAEGQDLVSDGSGVSETPTLWIKAGSSPEAIVLDN